VEHDRQQTENARELGQREVGQREADLLRDGRMPRRG